MRCLTHCLQCKFGMQPGACCVPLWLHGHTIVTRFAQSGPCWGSSSVKCCMLLQRSTDKPAKMATVRSFAHRTYPKAACMYMHCLTLSVQPYLANQILVYYQAQCHLQQVSS